MLLLLKPVKRENEILNCFFTEKLHLAFRQLKYKDIVTLKQLRDCAVAVNNKKNPLAV